MANLAGVRVVIESTMGRVIKYSFYVDFGYFNNQDGYEGIIIGLQILIELRARNVWILGDS